MSLRLKTGDQWYDGQYDGSEGFVESLFKVGGDHTNTATIHFTHTTREWTLPTAPAIPVFHLMPVAPNSGEIAIALTGKYRGQRVKVMEGESSASRVYVETEDGALDEVPKKDLCKWVDPSSASY